MDGALDLGPLRSARRRVVRPLVAVMVVALANLDIEYGALARPTLNHGLGVAFETAHVWVVLLTLSLPLQLLVVWRWSVWAAAVAKLLHERGAPGLDLRRLRAPTNLRRPTSTAAELVAVVTATSTWAGEWRREQIAPLVRAWSTAWRLRIIATVVLIGLLVAPESGDGGLFYVAHMLRDLALLCAGPLTVALLWSVEAALVRSTPVREVWLPRVRGSAVEFVRSGLAVVVAAAGIGAGAWACVAGIGYVSDATTLGVGLGGIALLLIGPTLIIVAALRLARACD